MISKTEIAKIASLHQKKFRREYGLFIVEGEKASQDLLNSDFIVEYVLVTERMASQMKIKKGRAAKIEMVSIKEMDKMSAMSTPPEVLCVARIPKALISPGSLKKGLSLLLDDIRDPGNLGTIIRIADWFGIKTVVCSEKCTDAYNPKAVQAAMGSLFRVTVVYRNALELLEESSALQIPVFAAVLDGENIFKAQLDANGVILVGGESHGIQSELLPFVTRKITIPAFSNDTTNQPDSLNAAMAAAIVCSEFRRRMLP